MRPMLVGLASFLPYKWGSNLSIKYGADQSTNLDLSRMKWLRIKADKTS
jgi:hypothetical protein